MLIIRHAQMAALANASFEAWLVEHLRRFFAVTYRELGAAETLAFVKSTTAQARQHGLSEGPDICSFLDLALTFGADFDRTQPWAESILATANGRASTMTMDRLHEAATAALEADAATAALEAEAAQVAPRLAGAEAGLTLAAVLEPPIEPVVAGGAAA
jgi:hypothetical protein